MSDPTVSSYIDAPHNPSDLPGDSKPPRRPRFGIEADPRDLFAFINLEGERAQFDISYVATAHFPWGLATSEGGTGLNNGGPEPTRYIWDGPPSHGINEMLIRTLANKWVLLFDRFDPESADDPPPNRELSASDAAYWLRAQSYALPVELWEFDGQPEGRVASRLDRSWQPSLVPDAVRHVSNGEAVRPAVITKEETPETLAEAVTLSAPGQTSVPPVSSVNLAILIPSAISSSQSPGDALPTISAVAMASPVDEANPRPIAEATPVTEVDQPKPRLVVSRTPARATFDAKEFNLSEEQAAFLEILNMNLGHFVSPADFDKDPVLKHCLRRDRLAKRLPVQLRCVVKGKSGSGYRITLE